jgi:beta-galactosidase
MISRLQAFGIAQAICLATLVGCLSSPAVAQRQIVSLDQGWRFKEAPVSGAYASAFDDSAWDDVMVPHAFPPVGNPNHLRNYNGEAWYRLKFDAPAQWKGKRVFLRFDAVAIVSDTYLNGKALGEHRGGFSAFTFEVTDRLRYGASNQIALRDDDRWNNDVAPLESSLLYGGIYRHVWLIVTDAIDITPMDYSSPGVFLTQQDVSADAATVDVKTEISSAASSARSVTVRTALLSEDGRQVMVKTTSASAAPAQTTNVHDILKIDHPHLWAGVADPYLYSVRVELLEDGHVLDQVTQPLGLRFFRFDPKLGFFLNGAHEQIHGVCLHQDWGALGWAVTPAQEKEDLRILRQMGADGIRLVHYPHSQSALDLYDQNGMLIWSELAQFRLVSASQAYRDNVRQQLTEMIRQNFNHPSIIMWSLYNELASNGKAAAEPIVKDLNNLAHEEDPTRPTIGADSGDTIWNMRTMVAGLDLIGDNNYSGWYSGAPADMNSEIVKINALYGNRGLAISEYGAGAKITDHKQNLVTGEVTPRGSFQPEEWQALVHEGNYRAIRNHPVVWGSFLWLAFDTGGLPRQDGSIEGGNIKGLVTQDRATCKDAYYFYQANWTTKPMLYLTSRRDINRSAARTPVKVYSNEPAVTLRVNGKSYGQEKPDDVHAFHWSSVALEPGRNTVEATASDGLKDTAVWILGGSRQ